MFVADLREKKNYASVNSDEHLATTLQSESQ